MIHTITVNGFPCEYVDHGSAGKPPLVLLHGWAQDHRLFRHLAPILARDFHVYALNFRGHDAQLTDVGDFTADDLASDVIGFLDLLGLEQVRFVSTSHGCWVNIEVQDRLADRALGKTVVIDWLMQPFPGFHTQIREGCEPETVVAARQSLFTEWTEGTDVVDVLDHVDREMTWFGVEMWMRACREIEKAYGHWGDPLQRMSVLADRLQVAHIYSQPLADDYRVFQEDFSRENTWFTPVHLPGQTHFPTLENPEGVAKAIAAFYS
ncbi:pimeloyl-ACP methyl ester carboxylesterase [Nocardioides zeae]|uniref:Pimeloyl-ACP methyl ester carboxylesterase n=2 Tax=Nocardioides zeae TaxID=1457234 RepID=A0ACC6IFD3_9ACTN|nr:alpha/beta hydrolase [Nocardioides zeae]MDQ1105438.1 pimeloyl-ACP methyl ester carboxylesterase [Nocardioides zeae]MDR6174865.1 pimeloyl-ACP methyl ester carboxylesterase [Nocardioides zeae]MDR6209325.1 pimeloyl-ACP methyl ester carboxylesterase [Nocardioides zeae]